MIATDLLQTTTEVKNIKSDKDNFTQCIMDHSEI
jgi:hypothetical protein